MIKYMKDAYKSEDIKGILTPLVEKWFFSRFSEFSLPQLYGVMEIHKRNNILISAPTGGTKTLTAFLSILNELVNLSEKNELEDKVYCVYISPLKALSTDIFVNLEKPLKEMEAIAGKKLGINIAVRTGDTSAYEKQKMLEKVPHILIITPESLGLVLSSYRFIGLLRDVQWCIVDEVHALAENKRGVHLSISLERLQDLSKNMTRVGLSATIAPLEEIAKFLVGDRECKIADINFSKKFDLRVISPVGDLIDVTQGEMHNALYNLLDNLIQEHKTTLVFTNTRAGTERAVHHLKEKFPKKYTENIGAHHGSLSKSHRLSIERRLREGKLKAVVCSTSLELGIDIGFIDMVVCLGSPKSVARFLQRCLPYNSKVLLGNGTYREIGEIVENKLDVEIISFDEKKGFIKNKIRKYHKNESNNLIKINTHSGSSIECTKEHPLMTRDGWKQAKDLKEGDEIAEIFTFDNDRTPYIYEMIDQKKFYVENRDDFLRKVVNFYIKNKKIKYSELAKVIGIKENHLQNYIRQKGRRKGIRLDLFLKIMGVCNVNKEDYFPYLAELKSKSHHRKPLPLKINRELMWLAGIIASDGCIVKNKLTNEHTIKIGNKDFLLLEECQKIFRKFGFRTHFYERKYDGFKCLECGSTLLAQIFISLGIKTRNKSRDIEISNLLYKLPKKLVIPFIEGVLEGDGNVHNGIRIFSASPNLVKGLHNLLNRCGIHNYFVEQKAKPSKLIPKINHPNIYCLYISRSRHIRKFLDYCLLKGKKTQYLDKKKISFFHKDKDLEQYLSWVKVESIHIQKCTKPVYNLTLGKEPNNYFVESVLTHNCGRAGHSLHETVKGRMIVMDRDDLVECSVLLKNAIEKKIDRIHIPENCLDVLAQQIYGMAIQQKWNIDELFVLIKKSYCYRNLKKEDFMDIISYLSGEYISLEDRHIYSKIWLDKETKMIGRRGKLGRVIYMTNIGTIPDETSVVVKVGEQTVGTIDEAFLERLKPRDVFVLGGDTYEFKFSRGMVAQVSATAGRPPTVPSWFSEMLPLSFDLALDICRFRRYVEDMFVNRKNKEEILGFINSYLYVDENAANAIYLYFYEQFRYAEIPNDRKLVTEFYSDDAKKYVIFHSLYGRRVNDVLSRAVAYAISRLQHRDVEIGINDNGFFLSSKGNIQAMRAFGLLKPDELNEVMKKAIERTEVLKRRFRHCAGRALMILRQYKGKKKRVGKQQVSSMILMNAVKRISQDFSILKEARREVLEDLMDVNNAKIILEQINEGKIEVKQVNTSVPSPFAFNLIVQGYTDIMKMEDKIEFVRRMHQMVLAKIGKDGKDLC